LFQGLKTLIPEQQCNQEFLAIDLGPEGTGCPKKKKKKKKKRVSQMSEDDKERNKLYRKNGRR